ncbi:FAD-dependent oxidoreductase [Hoyosella sp. YIM 151337]|uniref:FAD-dependent oxidoreductase n=1 Tax=Hoyosella sp. YIM 151337 TaxID=2992742 RepID=UPI00223568AD|nr:FAD-dependent oxidoreductase [Hoyosella sp. YIM 151337]MCW4355194.1 FAD-dependent oxidoreductase [Hoyosella sp. YIM 151337]
MPHVITQSCCNDGSCVSACPVNCIHPGPNDPRFGTSQMLYIDPAGCIDCGACLTACPVDAIKPDRRLTADEAVFAHVNADYFEENPHEDRAPLGPVRPRVYLDESQSRLLHVAIVGSGPAGMYTADEILRHPGARVDVFERLNEPFGLARFGVAPDHRRTRSITDRFRVIANDKRFTYHLGVEIGKDLTHEQLAANYAAVVYAVGASSDHRLAIEGEELAGSMAATEFVGWYNGHVDHRAAKVRLSHSRVVIVGNGNVALDAARILTADPERLAETDISRDALAALRRSRVCEVVLLGRRGPEHAAFTLPELIGLQSLPDVDIIVDNGGEPIAGNSQAAKILAEMAAEPNRGRRRIVLRFRTAPVRVVGAERVEGIEVARTKLVPAADGSLRATLTDDTEIIETDMVLRSVGYRGRPIPSLPFDDKRGTVPNDKGRVTPGTYVVGWIKRGPTGFIGTNRNDAQETVASLIADVRAERIQLKQRQRRRMWRKVLV